MSDSIHGSFEPMHSEAIPQRDSVESIGSLLRGVMGENLGRKMSANQRAMVAWHGSNGDRERAHTTRVFLRKPKVVGADPVICVYVDSHSFLTDLTANRDIYLTRLANWGLRVSGIEFGVDREAHRHKGSATLGDGPRDGAAAKEIHPSPQLEEEVKGMVADMPDELREKISKAIIASKIAKGENNCKKRASQIWPSESL